MKLVLLFCFTLLLISNVTAQQPMQIREIERQVNEIRIEKDLNRKIKIYRDFKKNSVWRKEEDFLLNCAILEQNIALSYATINDINAFIKWLSRIKIPVWYSSTKESGYQKLSEFRKDQTFKKEIALFLKEFMKNKSPDNKIISQYSKYLLIYLKDNENVVNPEVRNYLDFLYQYFDGYFLDDFGYEKKGIPLAGTMTVLYSKNLLESQEKDKIISLLAKSILAKNFNVNDLNAIETLLPGIGAIEEKVLKLITQEKAKYSELVHKLLKSKTIYQIGNFQIHEQRYLVLDFWGTWCIPCRATHPKLIKLYKEFNPKGVELISIAREAKAEKDKMMNLWKAAIEKDKMVWPQLLNNENDEIFDAVKAYSISQFPTKILLDQNYNLVEVYTGFEGTEQLEEKLKSLVF